MTSHPNVKINLGLSVLRRRPDGFHDLETLFIPYFGIRDTLSIEPSESFGVSVVWGGSLVPCPWDPQKDLTVRAYGMLREDFGLPPVRISLEKYSPVGAGLGGGSADGAFALRMLSDMFSLGLSDGVLASYAARLGSDCAFFIYNRPMLGTGRGEVLTPWDIDLSGHEIRVVVPEGVSVSTAQAYGGIVPRERKADPGMPLREALKEGIGRWKDVLVNDFEETVFAAHPQLMDLKRQLYDEGAVYAAMSGSGSALFGIF